MLMSDSLYQSTSLSLILHFMALIDGWPTLELSLAIFLSMRWTSCSMCHFDLT